MNGKRFTTTALILLLGFAAACAPAQPTAGPTPTPRVPAQRPPALAVRAEAVLKPSERPGWGFGDAIAVSGDVAVVGAGGKNAPSGNRSGAVYVYQRRDGAWVETARLAAGDADADDQYDARFGQAVAFDGDTLVVGAPDADDPAIGDDCGAVYVFRHSGETWAEQTKLAASDLAAGDGFGTAVALSGDTVVVRGERDLGVVYVFWRDGSDWSEQARLTIQDDTAKEWDSVLGGSIALSGDTLAFGADFVDAEGQMKASVVYVFDRSGSTWAQTARLTAGDDTADGFSMAVALSGDTLAVGAPLDSDAGLATGAVYVFQRDGDAWSEQAKLTAGDSTFGFGLSVAIEGDTVVVGANPASLFTLRGSQTAWVFQRSGAAWFDQLQLTGGDDVFGGVPVAISGDTVLVGAPGEFGDKVYVYELTSQ